jgi:hypothetical protein
MRPAAAAAVAAGSLILIAALALVLTDSKQRESGSNNVAELEPVAEIQGSGMRCQRRAPLPADTAAVRILLGTYGAPTPDLEVTATSAGRPIASGILPGGGREGHVDVPLAPVVHQPRTARVCVRIEGDGRTVLYGSSGIVRLEWLRPGRETWLDLAPAVARRFGYGKANAFGAWLLPIAGLVLALAWLLAARILVRELRA